MSSYLPPDRPVHIENAEDVSHSPIEVSLSEIVLFYMPALSVNSYPHISETLKTLLVRSTGVRDLLLSQTYRPKLTEFAMTILQVWRSVYLDKSNTFKSLQEYLLYASDERLCYDFTDMNTSMLLADIFSEAKLSASLKKTH